MRGEGLDALLATMPSNVLLLTGYFPVVGTALALITSERQVTVIAPRDERELAAASGADEVVTFEPASLQRMSTAAESVRPALEKVVHRLKLDCAAIGWESGETFEPASYASVHLYGNSIPEMLRRANLKNAAGLFSRMKARLTRMELERVRRACRIAAAAFQRGRERLRTGMLETEAAAEFRTALITGGVGFEGVVSRADGFVFCMAGVNSSEAFGAYARSRAARINHGDFVLTHSNSHADGYWTDITRTYCMGPPADRQRRMYNAVLEARQAALDAIRPGARAADIDEAARDVMRAHGLGNNFKHPAGHGVGFAAIDHNAIPRLHPLSEDRLETGMVFNVEPAAYIDGFGGLRHCDMVAVVESGADVLTPWDCTFDDLIR